MNTDTASGVRVLPSRASNAALRTGRSVVRMLRTNKEKHLQQSVHQPIKFKKVGRKSKGLLNWLYSASLVIFLIIFLGFNSVLPIDTIASSTTSSSLAVKALIIVVACAAFVVISIVLYVLRILVLKLYLQDIPKAYIPITPKDIPSSCSEVIQSGIIKSQKIQKLAYPQGVILHPGLYHIPRNSDTDNELPDNLIYENVVRAIGEDIKYKNVITVRNTLKLVVDKNLTLRDILTKRFGPQIQQQRLDNKSVMNLKDFLLLYEKLRFSGAPIQHKDFIRLMNLWNQVQMMIYENNQGQY